MSAAAAAGATTAATTKAAAATKIAGFAKVAKVLTVKWTLIAAVTTASVGTAVYVHETDVRAPAVETPPVATTSMTRSAAEAAPVVAPVPVETAALAAIASSEAPAPAPRPRPLVASPAPSAAPPAKGIDAFREELGLIDGARGALASGDTSTALRLVEEYATRYPSGAFVVERDVIRIDALAAAGRTDEAVRSAHAFLALHPGAAQASRISKMVEKKP
jgi:hypothetical protein